ncbi:hypothetical protein AMECASPLE_038483 [Ameca splendens]|uniref:Uncharacterized protein n=1 Tax=Ameca splendens TaxID=208324 RepID=A0ABV0ZJF0_9TELE
MATPNQDTNIEHMPPNPNTMNPFPTVTHTAQAPHIAPLQASPPHPAPHHAAWRDCKARAPRRGNRADTSEHRAHNGVPDPTRCKLTWQEFPSQRQAPHHRHCNDSPGRNINQLSPTITA